VEVRIGVQQAARELVLESNDSADVVAKKVAEALAKGTVLDLVDEKGRRVVVPGDRLAYVEIAPAEARRVGFGTI
jgi:ABC-type hemin transport system substrate-binding protein